MIRKDLTGKKIGRLTVLRLSDITQESKKTKWICQCECGKIIEVFSGNLTSKTRPTQSCGCLSREKSSKRMKEKNPGYKHGKNNTRLHVIWDAMKKRCYLKSHIHYSNYGGRGITVCEEWRNDFLNFYNWAIANGYKEDLTIDRIDSDKNYSPDNCRWITHKEQQNNKRTNHFVEYKGRKYTISQLAEEKNIKYDILLYRINKGWDLEDAINLPVMKGGQKYAYRRNN